MQGIFLWGGYRMIVLRGWRKQHEGYVKMCGKLQYPQISLANAYVRVVA
jgi:hypothetical protein